MLRDPFEILGLARDACKSEIKKRYQTAIEAISPGPQQ